MALAAPEPLPGAAPVRLLLLGGSGEAAALARHLADDPRVRAVTSLAGRTRRPAALAGDLRIGGFGGVPGLTAYLRAQSVDLVVDATHPFAARMAANAAAACEAAGVPRLKLLRPAWAPVEGDAWTRAKDVADAARRVLSSRNRRVFLSVGRQDLEAFAGLEHIWFLVRTIDPLATPCPIENCQVVQGRGPFTEADETALLRDHRIDLVVSKNSGGSATYAKIAAARQLGLPVVVIDRPTPPPGETVASVEEALAWVGGKLPAN